MHQEILKVFARLDQQEPKEIFDRPVKRTED
jgi:hypothetical protein